MERFLLVDGHPIMHRAYHALPLLTSKKGLPTNVVYGFLSMINKAISDFHPNYLLIAFDTPKPTFRHQLYKNYQIQRPKMKDDFKIQIPLVKKAIVAAGLCYLEKDGYEADDIIGSIVEKIKNLPLRIIIITGDRDIFQLIDKNIYVAIPESGLSKIKIYDQEAVKNKLNLLPKSLVDYKALVGDNSDNYPGAKNIGPKTAIKLLEKFKTVENLYQNLSHLDSEKIKKILIHEKENVFLSKKLAQINCHLDLDFQPDNFKFSGFKPSLKSFLEEYQMYSLLNRFFSEQNKKEERVKKKNYEETEQKSLF